MMVIRQLHQDWDYFFLLLDSIRFVINAEFPSISSADLFPSILLAFAKIQRSVQGLIFPYGLYAHAVSLTPGS